MDTELFMECEEEELEPWQQIDDGVDEEDCDYDFTEPVEYSPGSSPTPESPPPESPPPAPPPGPPPKAPTPVLTQVQSVPSVSVATPIITKTTPTVIKTTPTIIKAPPPPVQAPPLILSHLPQGTFLVPITQTVSDEDWSDSEPSEEEEEDDENDEDWTPEEDSHSRDEEDGRSCLWEKSPFFSPVADFDDCVDEELVQRHDWTPYMYFKLFVSDDMLQDVADQTNLIGDLYTTPKELEQVLGMYLHMGLVPMPSARAYWQTDTQYPAVCHVMTRDRFLKLLTLIQDDAKGDELWTLRPWLRKLRERFLRVPPEENHAVGEITAKPHGRGFSMWGRAGRGIRMWGRAGQSGFLYDFHVCREAECPEEGVVLKLTATLPAGKNHKVFSDSRFTSLPLATRLKERGIFYAGAVRMSKVKSCSLMEESELKELGRGSVDFRVNRENVVVVRWYDDKALDFLSSFVGVKPLSDVKCWDRTSKTHVTVPRPAIAEAYSRSMGGVDLLCTLSTLYTFHLRSRRRSMCVWWHMVTLALVNAWILYRRDQDALRQKPMQLRRFQAAVGTSLTGTGQRLVQTDRSSSPPPRKRLSSRVTSDVRKDGLDHFPTWETRQRCKHCSATHFTHVYCEKCKVHLCLNKDRNCFKAFHLTP